MKLLEQKTSKTKYSKKTNGERFFPQQLENNYSMAKTAHSFIRAYKKQLNWLKSNQNFKKTNKARYSKIPVANFKTIILFLELREFRPSLIQLKMKFHNILCVIGQFE